MCRGTASIRPTPVLMIPLRRCGSHALRLRLNFSPHFYSPYPLHIVDFMPLVQLYGDLADDDVYFQLVVDIIGLQTASMVKWDGVVFDPVATFEAIRSRPRSVHSVVWELLFQAGAAHDARVVMDKSLDSVHYADEFVHLFDNMLFLNVVRDPRAQVASMNRAIIHDFDTLLNTITWVKAHDAARRLISDYPIRVLTVRFEDFVQNEELVLRHICDFLGIDFLDEMVEVGRSEEAQRISGLSTLWESNASRPIAANVDKFKNSLTSKEIELIETLAGEHMEYYGYERMTSGSATITEDAAQKARMRSTDGKNSAWEQLRQSDRRDYVLRRNRRDVISMIQARLMASAQKSDAALRRSASAMN